MSEIPFVLSLDNPTFYDHRMFPNRIYRQLHARHHDPLDMHTLGLIARLGAHGHHLGATKRNGELTALTKDNKSKDFEVHLDVGLFDPSDLSVKVVSDCVVIEGKHEEREDEHGHVSRHFVRRYIVPKGYDMDAIASTLSTDGVLNVRVPKPKVVDDADAERVIPIKQVGPSDLFLHKGSEAAAEAEADKNGDVEKNK